MSEWKSCFFMGHREADERLLPRLESMIDRLITEENVRYFYVGGYGAFDRIAAAAVKQVKQKYPDIALMLVLPYHPAERPTEAPNGFDGTYHPEGLENMPRRYAIVRANQNHGRHLRLVGLLCSPRCQQFPESAGVCPTAGGKEPDSDNQYWRVRY